MAVAALTTGIVAITAQAPARAAAEFTLKIGTAAADDTEHNYAKALKAVVEEKSKGRIEVKIFPRNTLGSQSAVIQGMQFGTIEGLVTPADFYSGIDPRMGVLSFPFLFKDRAHANRVLANQELANKIADMVTPKGIVGCGTVSTADVRYMARNPIHKIADFKGLKMRINGTDAERERFRRLGVTSVSMNLPDMITALQNKTIDGSGSGITIWVNFNLETVSKELLVVEDTLIVSFCGLSKKWLDTLPADLRQMVITETRALFPKGVQLANEFNATLEKKWLDRGGKFNRLSPAEQDEIRKKLIDVGMAVTQSKPEARAFFNEVKAISDKVQ
jgi:TRAP-type C4-dicarboxylate transport system substrate-binding protein